MITNPILSALKKTPYASTDGIERDDKKVIARYFLPGTGCTWYVLEDDGFFTDFICSYVVQRGDLAMPLKLVRPDGKGEAMSVNGMGYSESYYMLNENSPQSLQRRMDVKESNETHNH